jgi:hypothetical protein
MSRAVELARGQLVGSAVGLACLLLAGSAAAQPEGREPEGAMRAPQRALELKIATGYAQAFGDVGRGAPSLEEMGGDGGAVFLGAGYRFDPHFLLGVYGTGAQFSLGSSVDPTARLFSASTGVEADWHFSPETKLDPWVELGTGWRAYWMSSSPGTTTLQGLEIARMQVGLDIRFPGGISIGPVIGADVSTFLMQETPGQRSYASIAGPTLNTFVFAGFMGRFDIAIASSTRATAWR